jgi:tRNA wybutosine-synthesizing protein 3
MNRVTEVKHGYKGPRNAPWARIKETLLAGLENARKEGVVDAEVEPYLAAINSHPDYVTSSSCYGRIVLIDLPDESKKHSQFLERWHRTVSFDEAWDALQKAGGKSVWFKVDPLIIHISCSGIGAAKKLIEAKARAGMKRGGIFHIAANRVQIELDGTHRMELPVKKAGQLLITKEYFRTVVSEANAKFRRNQKAWERLINEFGKMV